MSDIKKRRRLSADHLPTGRQGNGKSIRNVNNQDAKVGEILRRYGLYSSDLVRIRKIVEEGAIEALANSVPGRKRIKTVSKEQYNQLEDELDEKQKALAEMSVLFTSLKKKVNLE